MKKKKNLVMTISMIVLTLIIIAGSTYAFFELTINNDNAVRADITAKNLKLEFTDGPKVELTDVLPGATIIKTFSVENTGTETLYYTIYLNDVINSFTRNSDLVYTLTSTNDGAVLDETELPKTSKALYQNIEIPVNTTQDYTLTITYKNLNEDQNADMGKMFSGTLGIISGVKSYNLTGYAYDNNGDLMNSGTVEVHSDVITAPIQSDGSFTLVNVPVGDHEIIIKNNNNDILYQDDFKLEITTSTESINNNIIKADNETQTIKINCSNSGIEIKPLGNLYTVDLIVNNGYTTSPVLTAYSGQKTNAVTISPEENYEYDSITCTNDITYTLNDNKLYVNELTTSGTCTINYKLLCAYSIGYTWEYEAIDGVIDGYIYVGSGKTDSFTVPTACAGTYKLEVYGAQGGDTSSSLGGRGGKSSGYVDLNEDETLYIVCGQAGYTVTSGYTLNAFNGGGSGVVGRSGKGEVGGGGGATHIAKVPGTLASIGYDSFVTQGNGLIVAGGGSGAVYGSTMNKSIDGNSGGGTSGEGSDTIFPGTQIDGYAFGKGMDGNPKFSTLASGGGGGLFGGFAPDNNTSAASGAGGSGYIGGVTGGSMENGVQSGNGKATITLVSLSS